LPSSIDNQQSAIIQSALLNILEDSEAEKASLQGTQRAMLNILEDSDAEKANLQGTQRAVLNILEDSDAEKANLQGTQRAVLNILEDSDVEKANLQAAQRALLNILDDFDSEKSKVEVINWELREQIGQRQRAEEEIKKLNRELEQRVNERTAELAATNKELARSNADLEQFAYVASHDLQEPLRMVASYTQLLAKRYRGRFDRDADEFIGYAVNGAHRMHALINDLLAYSRVGTRGKVPAPTNSADALETALRNLRAAIEESDGRVTHDPLPVVRADETQLCQVFQNLVGNALKFHGPEPPRVHVSAQRDSGNWRFSVRDNGIGIDPESAQRIFVVFQRLHTSAEYPGTGIGLAIAKKIVERHGGRVWVESKPGDGATFYFTLRGESEVEKTVES
jgi:signal transduction histidine kinase